MASARTPRGLDGVQVEVTQQMRAILVDWMVEVSCEYNMSSQTLFLAVNYVDRLLEKIPFARSTLQLLGITCILLAAYVFPRTLSVFFFKNCVHNDSY